MEYSQQVQDHFVHPRNVGEIEDADGRGKAGNAICGDVMLITLKVENDAIADIKFKTFGCAAAVATASALTEIAKNKTLDAAMVIQFQEVVDALGGLPQPKIHCSALAITTLRAAIANARGEHDGDLTKNETHDCEITCPKCPKK